MLIARVFRQGKRHRHRRMPTLVLQEKGLEIRLAANCSSDVKMDFMNERLIEMFGIPTFHAMNISSSRPLSQGPLGPGTVKGFTEYHSLTLWFICRL
jgi:hypothetical protein